MNVFDIIGPVMIGPSSSHTAGAVRIAKVAYQLLGNEPKQINITLFGSFSDTYKGHGTDKALLAGSIGIDVDDVRIRDIETILKEKNIEYTINVNHTEVPPHPNTAEITLKGNNNEVNLIGISVGGGNIKIIRINGLKVSFKCINHTLIISHQDKKGVVATLTSLLADSDTNIGQMSLYRSEKGGQADMVIETDEKVLPSVLNKMKKSPFVHSVTYVEPIS